MNEDGSDAWNVEPGMDKGMTRRRILGGTGRWMTAAGGAALGAALAACGPLRDVGQERAKREVQTVEVYTGYALHGGRMEEAMAGTLRRFDETVGAQQGYRTQHTVVPWGEMQTKVQTVVAAGTPPDAFRGWHSTVPVLAPTGTLAPLDPFIQRDKEWSQADIYPAIAEGMQYDGKSYAAPISVNVDFLYYNKGLLRQAGLDTAKLPADLEGWGEWGERTTELGPDRSIARAGFLPFLLGWATAWAAVFGGQFYDV